MYTTLLCLLKKKAELRALIESLTYGIGIIPDNAALYMLLAAIALIPLSITRSGVEDGDNVSLIIQGEDINMCSFDCSVLWMSTNR